MQHEINQDSIDEAHLQIEEQLNASHSIDYSKSDQEILKECLKILPCSYIPAHTKENIPKMIVELLDQLRPTWTSHDIILDLLMGIEKWYEQGNNLPEEIKMPYLDATRYIHGEKEYHIELEKHKNMESKTYRDIFQNRKISQDIIDEAKRIVENAEKDATEYIKTLNSQQKT